MSFEVFRDKLTKNFKEMVTDENAKLFVTDINPYYLWQQYLDAYPTHTNDIFRERRKHECTACGKFIRTIGNVVTIKDNKKKTIWDIDGLECDEYKVVAEKMNELILNKNISDIFLSPANIVGNPSNIELTSSGTITWHHFYVNIPEKFIADEEQIPTLKAIARDNRNVFKRSLDEISNNAVDTVLSLIYDKNLYRGEEWKESLTIFRNAKDEYDKLETIEEKELYAWNKSLESGVMVSKIRNHSIGQLLIDIDNNVALDIAVFRHEKLYTNYKRPRAIFTEKDVAEMEKIVNELGLTNSLARRFANIDDISVNDALFINRNINTTVEPNNVFTALKKDAVIKSNTYTGCYKQMSIDELISKLNNISSLDILFENRHINNLVSLITSENADSKSMFHWNNNFSWAYNGNQTDSLIKKTVSEVGGDVNGYMRFSIAWNDIPGQFDNDDLDAHCYEELVNGDSERIFYGKPVSRLTGGKLDHDERYPNVGRMCVENITFDTKENVKDGSYIFAVNNYENRGGKTGFAAELEIGGNIYQYEYRQAIPEDHTIPVAKVICNNGKITVTSYLEYTNKTREVWNISTNKFVHVKLVTLSPNFWGNNNYGNKHYMFFIDGCLSDDEPNGFYNEFLMNELLKYKRVCMALGSRCKVPTSSNQLSGLGFSSTKKDNFIVKINNKDVYNVII